MSEKSQKIVMRVQNGRSTSRYLQELNQRYARQDYGGNLPWEDLDEELKLELVVKFLLSLQKIDSSQFDEVKSALEEMFERDDDFVEAALNFMQEEDLISVKDGVVRLTEAGRDVLK